MVLERKSFFPEGRGKVLEGGYKGGSRKIYNPQGKSESLGGSNFVGKGGGSKKKKTLGWGRFIRRGHKKD